jgi:hypothetical protein
MIGCTTIVPNSDIHLCRKWDNAQFGTFPRLSEWLCRGVRLCCRLSYCLFRRPAVRFQNAVRANVRYLSPYRSGSPMQRFGVLFRRPELRFYALNSYKNASPYSRYEAADMTVHEFAPAPTIVAELPTPIPSPWSLSVKCISNFRPTRWSRLQVHPLN